MLFDVLSRVQNWENCHLLMYSKVAAAMDKLLNGDPHTLLHILFLSCCASAVAVQQLSAIHHNIGLSPT